MSVAWRTTATALLLIATSGGALAQGGRGEASRPPTEPPMRVAQRWPDSTSWRAIGPAAFGGRVDDIEAVPGDPRIIFVASASGGVFRSTNHGTTWTAVSDPYFATMSVGDIALAPSDPRIVWAGMGEPNNRQSSTWGDGIYKSVDGGTSWRHMGLRETQTIGRVVVDPRNANIVFVAAVGHLFGPNEERGVYRTRDGGATWTKVLAVDANTGATDIVMTPDGRTLVAAMYQRRRRAFGFAGSGPGSGMWRSVDGGDTWKRITAGLPSGELGRIGLDVSRSNPDIIFATVEARTPQAVAGATATGTGGGVFRSADRGATWTRQSSGNPRPSYFSKIRIDPRNPDRVWLAGVYLTRSTDGGKTFTGDSIAPNAHADHHAIWIDPADSRHMLLGNDGGVYFTYDGARTWIYADNLPIAQFYDIAIDAREPYWIYGGTQDNGSWAFPSATYAKGGIAKNELRNTVFGDGFQAAVDPVEPRFVYANSQNGRIFLADMVTREEHHIQPSPPAGAEPYRFNWNMGNHLSPNDSTTYYVGAHKLLTTTNRGQSWQEISPDLTKKLGRAMVVGAGFAQGSLSANDGVSTYGNITTINESPRARGTIYVGTDDGNVQVTTDAGVSWTDVTRRFPFADTTRRASYVSKVLASRHDARTAYAAFDGHWDDDMTPYLFRTTDGGGTWRSVAGDLPPWKPVKTLAEDPRNSSVLYAGTEFGLYWTIDGGAHWTPAPGNIPPVMITRILFNERDGDLIVATHGRGVFILDDASALGVGDVASMKDDVRLLRVHAATEVQHYREFPQPGSNDFVAPNAPDGTFITYVAKSDPPAGSARVSISVVAQDGTIVSEMTGPDAKGVHRALWDLRYRFKYVPPAADSGYYGPPRAAYVPPGRYTVKLVARGRELAETVDVVWDPRGANTPESLRQRFAINTRARDVSRVYYELTKAFERLAIEVARMDTASKSRPQAGADSLVSDLRTRLTQIRTRAAAGVSSFPGGLFDLLAAVESSSLPPTESQHRLMESIVAGSISVAKEVNEILTVRLPAVRAKLGLKPSTDAHLSGIKNH